MNAQVVDSLGELTNGILHVLIGHLSSRWLLERSRAVILLDMAKKRSARAQDENQLAASIVAQAVADGEDDKNPAAVALGRLGGLKGGNARAAKLSAKRRSDIAKKAAKARWRQRDLAD